MVEPYREGHQLMDGFRTDVFVCHPCSLEKSMQAPEGGIVPVCHLWDEADDAHRPLHNRIPLQAQIEIANYEFRLGKQHDASVEVLKLIIRREAEVKMGVRHDVLSIKDTGPFTFDFLAKRSDKTLYPMFPTEFEEYANELRNEYGFPMYLLETPFYQEVTLAQSLLPAEVLLTCALMNRRHWGSGNQMLAGSLPDGMTEDQIEKVWEADDGA